MGPLLKFLESKPPLPRTYAFMEAHEEGLGLDPDWRLQRIDDALPIILEKLLEGRS